MMKSRRILFCLLALTPAWAGCVMPPHNGRPIASSSDKEGYETVIRIDESGNVLEASGERPPASGERQLPVSAPIVDAPSSDVTELNQGAYTPRSPIAQSVITTAGSTVISTADAAPNTRAGRQTYPTPPPGIEPTVVRSTKFTLEYDDEVLGPDGIARVELYGTLDAGRTWHKLGEDSDRRSPYVVDMPQAGVYGFRIAVAGHNGLASRPPKDGDKPELWVQVDLSEPMFRGNLRTPESAAASNANESKAELRPNDASAPRTVAKPASGEVQPAARITPLPPENDDWQTHLDRAIALAEQQLASDVATAGTPQEQFAQSLQKMLGNGGEPNDPENTVQQAGANSLSDADKARLDARLRLLYLAAGRREDAIRSSRHQSTEQSEFWSHELHGIDLLMAETDRTPAARQAAAALVEFRDAANKLAAVSELQVRNLTFCTAAHSFGVYETSIEGANWKHTDYREKKFEPDQPVVLYFEVNNFENQQHTSREFPDGAWRTSLRGSYTIIDPAGRPVERRELKLRDDICRNRRHDYFVAYKTWIPKLNPGRYTLELLVEDALAGKIGTTTIDFEIVSR